MTEEKEERIKDLHPETDLPFRAVGFTVLLGFTTINRISRDPVEKRDPNSSEETKEAETGMEGDEREADLEGLCRVNRGRTGRQVFCICAMFVCCICAMFLVLDASKPFKWMCLSVRLPFAWK